MQRANVVVGNLVYSLALGMSVPDVSGSAIANLEVETLQHKNPTFHGDTIYAETRVLEATESRSKPDRGIVTVETRAFNQHGDEVCYFRRKVMVWKRDIAPRPRAAVRGGRGLSLGGEPVLFERLVLDLSRRLAISVGRTNLPESDVEKGNRCRGSRFTASEVRALALTRP